MRIKLKDALNEYQWHCKFLILPRVIDKQFVFLEKVMAKRHGGYADDWWEYKLIERKEIDDGK